MRNTKTEKRTEEEIMELYYKYEHYIDQTIYRRWNKPKFLELHGLTNEDLRQYGSIGLYHACSTYDPSKGALQTYIINNIIWSINVEIKRDTLGCDQKYTLDLIPKVSFDKKIPSYGDDVEIMTLYSITPVEEDGYEEAIQTEDELIDDILFSIKGLVPERTLLFIELRIKEGLTHVQIGERFGVTRTVVRNELNRYEELIKNTIYEHNN